MEEQKSRPGVRADARRNMDRIRAAAMEVCRAQGLGAPIEQIARVAGTNPGTIYNRFGSREALMDDIVPQIAATTFQEAADAALGCEDPWEGFVAYVTRICEAQADNLILRDIVSCRYSGTKHLSQVCGIARSRQQEIIDRAQRHGSLRRDFAVEDLLFVFWSIGSLVQAAEEMAPDVWRRNLALLFDGLRLNAATPLPVAPLTPDQAAGIMLELGTAGIPAQGEN